MNRTLFASALAAALIAAPICASAGPDEEAPRRGPDRAAAAGEPARHGLERMGTRHRGPGRRGHRHGRRAVKALRALELTDAQRALLADGRAGAESVRADLRVKIKAALETPITGGNEAELRKARREKMRELVIAARSQVLPSAEKFVAALSPDQKARLALAGREARPHVRRGEVHPTDRDALPGAAPGPGRGPPRRGPSRRGPSPALIAATPCLLPAAEFDRRPAPPFAPAGPTAPASGSPASRESEELWGTLRPSTAPPGPDGRGRRRR